jgi:rubredoxin
MVIFSSWWICEEQHMPVVMGLDEIRPDQIVYKPSEEFFTKDDQLDQPGGPGITRKVFYQAKDPKVAYCPTAFISEYEPGRRSDAHYHSIDQFQLILGGKGKFARHVVEPYAIHFTRAYTSYGPLLPDEQTGWTLLVLRTRYDPGSQHGLEAQERLKKVRDRNPWQIHRRVEFTPAAKPIEISDVPGIKDDQGLFANSLSMAANTTLTAPSAAQGDGQFIVVVEGSLIEAGKARKAPAIVFRKPDDGSYTLQAGPKGLQALILNFPEVKARTAETKTPATQSGFKKWQCLMCAFAYDEALGLPDEGIAPGTRWEDVPETWSCPDCSATKSDFQMVEVVEA